MSTDDSTDEHPPCASCVSAGAGAYAVCPHAIDPVRELAKLLDKSGARITLDAARNVSLPCVLCGERAKPRQLIEIGRYTRWMGGNLKPGDAIVRPMCARCVELTK